MTMYDYLWQCMTMYDNVWLCITMYYYVWLCMTMYDYIWLYMTMYDYVWICMNLMTLYDCICLCMTLYYYVWLWITILTYCVGLLLSFYACSKLRQFSHLNNLDIKSCKELTFPSFFKPSQASKPKLFNIKFEKFPILFSCDEQLKKWRCH